MFVMFLLLNCTIMNLQSTKPASNVFIYHSIKASSSKTKQTQATLLKIPARPGMGPNSSGIMPSKYVHVVQSIFENIGGGMAVTFAADIIVFQNDVSLCDQNIFYHQIFPRLMTRRARGEGAVLGAGGQRRLWLYISTYKSLNEMKTLEECQKLIPWVGALYTLKYSVQWRRMRSGRVGGQWPACVYSERYFRNTVQCSQCFYTTCTAEAAARRSDLTYQLTGQHRRRRAMGRGGEEQVGGARQEWVSGCGNVMTCCRIRIRPPPAWCPSRCSAASWGRARPRC